MARVMELTVCFLLLFVLLAVAEAGPPKQKKVKCQDKKYNSCYKKDLYCPISCPRDCTVNCATCKPVCLTNKPPPPPPPPKMPKKVKCTDPKYRNCYLHELYCPVSCPQTCVIDGAKCRTVCPYAHPSNPPPPVVPSPSPPPPIVPSPPPPVTSPSPPPVVPSPSPPPPTVPPPPPPVTSPSPPPTVPSPSPSPPVVSTPPPPVVPSPSPPPVVPSPPPPKTAKCRNTSYPHCYGMEFPCPRGCLGSCEVDCRTCKPICRKSIITPFHLNCLLIR